LIRQRTMLVNALRGHFAELGIVVAQGMQNVPKLFEMIDGPADARLPAVARHALGLLMAHIQDLQGRIKDLARALLAWHRKIQASQRLETIPGIGHYRDGHCSDGDRSFPLQVRSPICSLAGLGAETKLQWRKRPPR
jgi:transposase